MRSFLNEPDKVDFTVSLVAKNNLTELRPTIESVLNFGLKSKQKIEIVAVDLASSPDTTAYLETVAHNYRNFRAIYAEDLGEAAARNLAFKQGRGRWLMLVDAGLVIKGDIFAELFKIIEANDKPALYGLYPLELVRENQKLEGFKPLTVAPDETQSPVEALEGGLLCFRRGLVEEVGFMDERFRYPYTLDLDYSQSFHDKGYPTIALPALTRLVERNRPVTERPNYGLSPEDQLRQRQKNWQHHLKSWGL
jgi:glycosyltransferase involved in cell wall biosynthesis